MVYLGGFWLIVRKDFQRREYFLRAVRYISCASVNKCAIDLCIPFSVVEIYSRRFKVWSVAWSSFRTILDLTASRFCTRNLVDLGHSFRLHAERDGCFTWSYRLPSTFFSQHCFSIKDGQANDAYHWEAGCKDDRLRPETNLHLSFQWLASVAWLTLYFPSQGRRQPLRQGFVTRSRGWNLRTCAH